MRWVVVLVVSGPMEQLLSVDRVVGGQVLLLLLRTRMGVQAGTGVSWCASTHNSRTSRVKSRPKKGAR